MPNGQRNAARVTLCVCGHDRGAHFQSEDGCFCTMGCGCPEWTPATEIPK
jgi:hypothetical protein